MTDLGAGAAAIAASVPTATGGGNSAVPPALTCSPPAAGAVPTGSASPAARGGWLRNGNAPGDPNSAPRCGARTRAGGPCRSPAMSNGRCRMHGGASTGATTRLGRALCGHARRKHGLRSAESLDELREFNDRARLARAMAQYTRVWPRPFRRAGALLKLLRTLGRMLPVRSDRRGGTVARWMMGYVRGPVNDVLRWLGERPLAPRERPDSPRVIAVLTGSVEACSIGDAVYRTLRRRALRQHAQRARRAAKAAGQGRPVKPTLPARTQAAHAPRGSSRERGRLQADRRSAAARIMSGQDARAPVSRQDVGAPTSPKPASPASAQGPYAPRGSSLGRSAGILPASSATAIAAALSRQDAGAPTSLKPTLPAYMQAAHAPRASSWDRGRLVRIMSGRDARAPVKPSWPGSTRAAHAPRAASPLAHSVLPFLRRARPPPAPAAAA